MQMIEEIEPTYAASREGVEARLMKMFGSDDAAAERETESRVSAFARAYVDTRRVSSDAGIESLVEEFRDSRLPEQGSDSGAYINYLLDHVAPHAINTASPRFIGHMTSALPNFVHHLGKLVTVMNQNMVKMETSKALSFYERQAITMMHRAIFERTDDFYYQHVQHGESTLGAVVSGGTVANITALWCARNAALGAKEGFAGVEAEGLAAALKFYGYEGAVIVGSRLMHYSFDKAAGLLGLGTRGLIKVETDREHRIDLSALRHTLGVCRRRKLLVVALVGIAGTTDSGAVDPLVEMAEIAREEKIHFHVDAAWGGALLFSQLHRHKLDGIERADSVTIDGHKQLYLPMGLGMILLADPYLARNIEKQARYIVRPGSIDLGKRTLEGSRPGMSLFLNAALNIIGRQGYEFLIDSSLRKTAYMAEAIRARPEFELLNEPAMNILTYRYLPETFRRSAAHARLGKADQEKINQFNQYLQKVQRRAGQNFVSRTTLLNTVYGKETPITALRVVLANPLTTEADIDAVLDDQMSIAAHFVC